ncbi:pyridoxamine 5'-phosphate oxidase family protein [Streptomyces mutabilis]|uniref:pyridoxamine 5'-phosphate oxidase family protein n=1 Tax=Streptomyces mutabilis TaxID=67332 RepID=UPI00178058AC|nr:pyridoxamine 5'-phosphate oxidase family protein [Streptomyces mutabilis]GGQ47354.1 hypothetical protein GCM10010279_66200 [Streptomyces mutabilis]
MHALRAQLAVCLLGRTAYGRAATTVRAPPFLATARHIVADGRVLLRMARRRGYHQVCAGSVAAYGADDPGSAAPGESLWTVRVVGRCRTHEPSAAEIDRFGPAPRRVDGEPFEPVHPRIEPRLGSVHVTEGAAGVL